MDPYKVLCIAPTASDDEVKKAYRELARKYHPDNYVNNPLADLAQEKMKEINEAYDTITKQRSSGSSGGYQSQYQYQNQYQGGSYTGTSGDPSFSRIRQKIMEGDLDAAEQQLGAMNDHGAEWHFLMGSVCLRRGWYDDARRYYQNACSLEPNNAEYRIALQRMSNINPYFSQTRGMSTGDNCGSICGSMLLADCCCECMGGDLVPCC